MKLVNIPLPIAIAITCTCAFTLSSLIAQEQTTIQASAPVISGISPDVPQSMSQIQQWRGTYGDEKKHADAFTTAAEWAKLWKHLGMAPHDPLDEKTQMGVCIYIGECPTAGYKPYIISAVERDGKLVVSYSTGQPGPQEMVAQEITHPWVAAVIRKSSLPVVFKQI